MSEKQLELFNIRPAYRVEQQKKLMSKEALLKWKARIFKHQQHTLNTPTPQQTSLFDPPRSHCDSDAINPFALKLHASQFYRMKGTSRRDLYLLHYRQYPAPAALHWRNHADSKTKEDTSLELGSSA